jgi:hypothetical protein
MRPLKSFVSYSSKDESLRKDLEEHLALLKREGAIETWTFRSIEAGDEWKKSISENLESAELIMLLVSASFMASDYCWNVEMVRAIQKHREGSARVIPSSFATTEPHHARGGSCAFATAAKGRYPDPTRARGLGHPAPGRVRHFEHWKQPKSEGTSPFFTYANPREPDNADYPQLQDVDRSPAEEVKWKGDPEQ